MTQPPRPPGDNEPGDPTAYIPPADPTAPPGPPTSGPPASGPPSYGPPPGPPTSGAPGYGPPTSGAPGYGPPAGAPGPGPYPPQGGFPPGGYPPQGGGFPGGGTPTGFATADDKTWALIAHFGAIVVGFIAPLISLLVKGNESPTVRAHAVESLNFQITWGVATIIASILAGCSFGVLFFLPMITWAIAIIFAIIGGIRANEGQLYKYPMSVRLVK